MRKSFLLALVIAVSAIVPVSAAANQWVGSRYERSDCELTINEGRPSLLCSKEFVTIRQATQELLIPDEACASGLRAVRRTGTLEERFFGFDLYAAPVPLARFNIAGNEIDLTERWLAQTDTQLGCV